MNNDRRKEIKNIYSQLDVINMMIERIKDDEQDYYDNIPENLQGGLRADRSLDYIETLEDAISDIEDVISSLKTI